MPMQPSPKAETMGPLRPSWIFCISASRLVIPGRAKREPGIHNHRASRIRAWNAAVIGGGYGFRVPRCARPRNDVSSLRRQPHFRRCGADVGVDVLFVFDEIVLEHAHQLARGL